MRLEAITLNIENLSEYENRIKKVRLLLDELENELSILKKIDIKISPNC